MEHIINKEIITKYKEMLIKDEKSNGTIEKYMHDVNNFYIYTGMNGCVSKEVIISYKQELIGKYAVTTVNAVLAALNSFLKSMGWYDCVVKSLKIQRDSFRAQERELSREEYYRLLSAAKEKGDERLYLLMQTICSTGIRVSELRFITVESLCTRRAVVSMKGKTRTVIIPGTLCKELRKYSTRNGIKNGSVFVTRNGKPLDRSNIFRAMKKLCELAHVEGNKVFPHNLRHLFACLYYQAEKDIAHLADILGHSSVDTTRIYLRKSSNEQEKQIELLGLVVYKQQNLHFVVCIIHIFNPFNHSKLAWKIQGEYFAKIP